MKKLGIEIKGREVRIVALEKGSNGEINDVTGNYKPIKLEDDENAQNVILFRKSLHATFESFNPTSEELIILNQTKFNELKSYL